MNNAQKQNQVRTPQAPPHILADGDHATTLSAALKCTRLPRGVVTHTNLASLRGKSLNRACAVVTIAPWSYDTAEIAPGDALFCKQFRPKRSAPLPCRCQFSSRVSTAPRFLKDLAVDGLSIIANIQPEEMAIVGDLGLDAAGVRVVECVAQGEY